MVDYNQYVADLYRNELGREPDAEGLNAWVGALSSGGLTPQQVADQIERSQEGVNYDVSRVYGAELGRAPDEAGATSWGQALASGAISDDEFVNRVRQSGEYGSAALQQYQDLINQTYKQEVGRTPDAAGAAQWAAALKSGAIKPEQLPSLFSNTNEGWVYDQYGNLFKRAPDDAAKAWVDALEKGALTRDQVMARLMASPEYVKLNPTKPGAVPVPGAGGAAAGGFPGYVTAYQNYAPMKPLADPRSQTFGFLYDTINQRLGRDVTPQGLLDVNSINAAFGGSNAGTVGMAGSAQQQTPASTGGYGDNNSNIVGGLLDARNLVTSLYQSELGRAPDDLGMTGWSNAIMGGMTQQQLLDAIRASAEYKARVAGNSTAYVPYSYDYLGGGSGNGGDGNGGGAYGGGGDSAAGSPAGDGGGIMG